MKIHILLLAAVATVALTAGQARADTVKTKTTVTQKTLDIPGVRKFDIASFDDNNDGIVTIEEAGDHLFHLFDLDSNGVLDNKEFYTKSVITIVPVERKTVTYQDINGNKSQSYNSTVFMQRTGLDMFAKNPGGLSPADFVKLSFLEMDRNHSHVIEPDEWRRAYIISRIPEADEQYRYNN